jgi:sulfatase maturation enzyme AslB (radical SAM superfamily)
MTKKFIDMYKTADGSERASVKLQELKTLWFNTGSRCNLSCDNCYIESNPKNDRLEYLNVYDVIRYLNEIKEEALPTNLIGLTGGEPFLNPEIISIIEEVLKREFDILILTNAFKALGRHYDDLLEIKRVYGDKLHLRISLDHYTEEGHEEERGIDTFGRTLKMITKLKEDGFNISLAGRSLSNETYEQAKTGYSNLLYNLGLELNLNEKLVIFPEMDLNRDVPEITTACWGILNKAPEQQMCASERMIVKKKGANKAVIMPCTLLAYDEKFELGDELKEAKTEVHLNHKFCAQFCVLGGASCSIVK